MTNRRGGRRDSKAPASNVKVAMSTKDFSHMRHRYYIVRPEPNKTCVPMIAVDELPKGCHLEGVPMTVTPQQIQEWDMARVGADIRLKHSFEIDFEPLTQSQRGRQPGSQNKYPAIPKKASEVSKQASNKSPARNEEASCNTEVKADTSSKSDAHNKSAAHHKPDFHEECDFHDKPDPHDKSDTHDKSESMRMKTDKGSYPMSNLRQQANDATNELVEQSKWEKENDRSKTQDAATPGVYGKKKFCTHWIRTGNCDYMQEGCRYLHVIPDAETRLRIGIRDMPRWAKEDLPSPPQEIHRARPHSSTPPKDAKKDTHKDWRNRGNRKAHAELPTGPSLTRPATMRSLTPTPQASTQAKQHGPQHGLLQARTISPMENTHSDLLAAADAESIQDGNFSSRQVQQSSQPRYSSAIGPQKIQSATAAAAQPSVQQAGRQAPMRQQQFTPLISNSSPLTAQSPLPSSFYGGPPYHNHGRFGYGSFTSTNQYSPFAHSPQQSNRAPSFDSRDARLDSGHWAHPSYQSQGITGSPHLVQPQPNPVSGLSTPTPWFQGLLNSPTPSFLDTPVGTIGHGRPPHSKRNLSASPIPGPPIMHKRLFRQPGESQYVEAQPEPKVALPKESNRNRSHTKGRGMTAFQEAEDNGGRSGQLGNLIALD